MLTISAHHIEQVRCHSSLAAMLTSINLASPQHLYDLRAHGPGKDRSQCQTRPAYHNFRVAFDLVPVMGGKAIWSDPGSGSTSARWAKVSVWNGQEDENR